VREIGATGEVSLVAFSSRREEEERELLTIV